MIHFFLEGGSTMVLESVECPVCGGTNVITHGSLKLRAGFRKC